MANRECDGANLLMRKCHTTASGQYSAGKKTFRIITSSFLVSFRVYIISVVYLMRVIRIIFTLFSFASFQFIIRTP